MFEPAPPRELSGLRRRNIRCPTDAVDAEKLRQTLSEASDKQIKAVALRTRRAAHKYQRVTARARVMIADQLPLATEVVEAELERQGSKVGGVAGGCYLVLGRKGQGEQTPRSA